MIRVPLRFVLALSVVCTTAELGNAQFVAEQVTVGNASIRLFQGSDAIGGVGDWYVSNGVVEAIIDDVGVQTVPAGVTAPPKQHLIAFTGGSLIDLGLVGRDNDQLTQMFTVGGLSTANFGLNNSVAASTTASSATITVTGELLGFDPPGSSDLVMVTDYTAAGSDNFLTITTTVTNTGGAAAAGLGGFLDGFFWTQRAIAPFSPLPGLGFNHAQFDLSNLAGLLELPPFAAGPGNVKPADGIADPPSGKIAGEVSYGLLGVDVSVDQDGAGGDAPVVTPVDRLFGISSVAVTALGGVPAAGALAPGGVLTYTRRLYVGDRNDVASVANDMITELKGRVGFETGTIAGNIDAVDTPDVAASVVATRTGGPTNASFPAGTPVSHFRTDASGAFSGIVLPEGDYDLEIMSPERDTVTVSTSVTPDTESSVPIPQLSGLGSVELTVFEKIKGVGKVNVPGRLTFLGFDGGPVPNFNKDFDVFEILPDMSLNSLEPESFTGDLAQQNYAYVADGTGTVQLKPGKYEVIASRGPEYTIKRKKVSVKEGKVKRAKFKVKRIVETPDAISADFHIHSVRSWDVGAGLDARVSSYAGENLEVMVSTEHNYRVDYSDAIEGLGLDGLLTSIVGNEATGSLPNPPAWPNAIGHINCWPVPVLPHTTRDGAVQIEYVAPNLIYSRMRDDGAEVVMYTHPRAGLIGLAPVGIFNNIGCNRCLNDIDMTCSVDGDCPVGADQTCTCVGFQADRAIDAVPNDILLDDDVLGPGLSGVANEDGFRNIDFDVMEIANGQGLGEYVEVRNDWFSLLNQVNTVTASGPIPFIPGTAVSDSHEVTLDAAGYHRTYVLGVGDDPASLDVSQFNTAVRDGRMVGTSGPYIEYSITDGATTYLPGDTVAPSGSSVTLTIRVQSTNWIPVEEVRIVRNGTVTTTFDAATTPAVTSLPKKPWSGSKKTERFFAEVEIALTEDSWLLVEAGAPLSPLPQPDPFASQLIPGLRPNAFTNPIFIDLGGDGFDPSGPLPSALLASRSIDDDRAHAQEHLEQHVPIHKITIPASAVTKYLGED